MIMDNQLQTILEHFHGLTELPVRWIVEEKMVLALDVHVFSDAYEKDVREQLRASNENICYQITPESLVYGYVRLLEPEYQGYLIIGPMIMDGDRHLEVVRLAEAFHRSMSDALWDYVNSLKFCRMEEFYPAMNTLVHTLRREKMVGSGVLQHQFSTHIQVPDLLQLYQSQQHSGGRQFQVDILYNIVNGRVEELRRVLSENSGVQMVEIPGFEGVSPLRTIQDVFITAVALCSATAVWGGVDEDLSKEWAARFISQAERARSFPEAQLGINTMMMFFAEQVAEAHRFSGQSELVRKAASYVAGHLNEKITVQQIAEALKINASYLSHEFKQSTGISLSELITREKMEEAKRLLLWRRASILEISQQLGFSSQQYFQNVFKKQTGMTPAQYQHMTDN